MMMMTMLLAGALDLAKTIIIYTNCLSTRIKLRTNNNTDCNCSAVDVDVDTDDELMTSLAIARTLISHNSFDMTWTEGERLYGILRIQRSFADKLLDSFFANIMIRYNTLIWMQQKHTYIFTLQHLKIIYHFITTQKLIIITASFSMYYEYECTHIIIVFRVSLS